MTVEFPCNITVGMNVALIAIDVVVRVYKHHCMLEVVIPTVLHDRLVNYNQLTNCTVFTEIALVAEALSRL